MTSNRSMFHTLWATRTGPGNSHHYSYFSLPVCKFISDGEENARPTPTLGLLMGGYAWEPYANLHVTPELFDNFHNCTTPELSVDEAEYLSRSVEDNWFYELYLNDLPAWAAIGERGVNGSRPLVYTEYNYFVGLSGYGSPPDLEPLGVLINPVTESAVPIEAGRSYNFRMRTKFRMQMQYQVGSSKQVYQLVPRSSEEKFRRYTDSIYENMLPSQKFFMINNMMVAVFIAVLSSSALVMIWKNNSSSNGEKAGECDAEEQGDTPLLQRDGEAKLDPATVYSHLNNAEVLGALIGNGWHLLAWAFAMAVYFNGVNPLEYGPGGQIGQMLYGYATTSIIGGYTSSRYIWQQNRFFRSPGEGEPRHSWKRTVALTVSLLPLLLISIVVIYAVAAVPTQTIDIISIQCVFRVLLLWLVGAAMSMAGASLGQMQQASCTCSPTGFISPLSYPSPKKHFWGPRFMARFEEKHRDRSMYLIREGFLYLTLLLGWFQYSFIYFQYRLFLMMSVGVKRSVYMVGWATIFNLVGMVMTNLLSSTVVVIFMFHGKKHQVKTYQWRPFFISACSGIFSFTNSILDLSRFDLVGAPSIIHYGGVSLLFGAGVACINGAVSHFMTSSALWLLFSNSKAD